MKQLKKPTKKQAILIASKKLKPESWLVERETTEVMIIISRSGKQKRQIDKV